MGERWPRAPSLLKSLSSFSATARDVPYSIEGRAILGIDLERLDAAAPEETHLWP